jgi:hypothetical protein
VNKAEATYQQTGLQTLHAAAATNPKNVQWVLGRRFPEEYGRRDNVQEIGAEDKASQTQAVRDLLMERLEKLLPEPEEPATAVEPAPAEAPADGK